MLIIGDFFGLVFKFDNDKFMNEEPFITIYLFKNEESFITILSIVMSKTNSCILKH